MIQDDKNYVISIVIYSLSYFEDQSATSKNATGVQIYIMFIKYASENQSGLVYQPCYYYYQQNIVLPLTFEQ